MLVASIATIGAVQISYQQQQRPIIPRGFLTSAMIADNTIVSADLRDGEAVRSADIVNGQVATEDLANNAVTSDKIEGGEVTSERIEDGTITSEDIAEGTIPPPSTGGGVPDDNSVTSAKIVDGEVNTADLANNAVTADKIADGAIQLNTHTVSNEWTVPRTNSPGNLYSVNCPAGEILLSGGYFLDNTLLKLEVNADYPHENGWYVRVVNPTTTNNGIDLVVYALCATLIQ